MFAQRGFGLGDLRADRARHGATVAHGLAADQVVGLDRRGAFVDRQDAGVAVVLSRPGFFDEAHATVHLHAQAGDVDRELGAPALDHRHQELIEGLALLAHGLVRMLVRRVAGGSGHVGDRACAFGQRAHRHQHALDVRVVDDGDRLARRAVDRAALHALARIGHGLLVGALGHRDALYADREARRVHHDEHVLEAAVLFADLRLGQVHGAGPLARDQLGQEGGLLLIRAGRQQRLDGTVGQHGAQREREVGTVQRFDAGSGNQLGQALAAELLRVQHALPAAFAELAESVLEAGGGRDETVFPTARFGVANAVQRCHHLFVEPGCFLEHRLRRV
ncbi:hypothetical protein D9M69_124280 [compost metagenome]